MQYLLTMMSGTWLGGVCFASSLHCHFRELQFWSYFLSVIASHIFFPCFKQTLNSEGRIKRKKSPESVNMDFKLITSGEVVSGLREPGIDPPTFQSIPGWVTDPKDFLLQYGLVIEKCCVCRLECKVLWVVDRTEKAPFIYGGFLLWHAHKHKIHALAILPAVQDQWEVFGCI